jgi:hypothetical protein
MIYNVFGCCKVEERRAFWEIVKPLDAETTYDLFFKIMRILEIAFSLETYESIKKLVRESLTELFRMVWKPYRKLHKDQ